MECICFGTYPILKFPTLPLEATPPNTGATFADCVLLNWNIFDGAGAEAGAEA